MTRKNKKPNKIKNKNNALHLESIKKRHTIYNARKIEKKQKRQQKIKVIASKIDKKLYCKANYFRIKRQKLVNNIKNFVINRFGKTTYTVYGLNLTKLVNILKQFNIENVVIATNLTFTACSKHNKKIKQILNDYCYKYDTIVTSNAYSFLHFVFTKKMLALSIFLVIFFYLFSNLFVLKININNYSYEVKKILQDNDVKVGTMLAKIDTAKLEKKIFENLDISFCDIKIIGNTLDINITLSSSPVKTDKQDINKVVVATCDCILSRQLIYSGTATKKFGDIIKKGDILVNNYIFLDENLTSPVIASGDIYGLIQKNERKIIPKKSVEKVPTGKVKKQTFIGYNKNFTKCESPYKTYKKTEDICKISDILPLYKKTVTYEEYQYKTIEYNKNMVLENYLDSVTKSLVNSMPISAKYKRRFYFITERTDSFVLDCYIEYEDKVSALSS